MTTARDANLRLEWRLRSKMPEYRRRVEQALAIVRRALDLGTAYVSVSGGKDSIALLHLCRTLAPDLPAWHIDSGMETPDTLAIIAQLAASFGVRVTRPDMTVDAMARLVGAWGYEGPDKLDGEWHWGASDWKAMLIDGPSRELCETHGYRVIFTGVRADESKGRTQRMRRFGAIHARKDGLTIACPLAEWSGLDSLAYAEAHGLPISALYTEPGIGRPEERRTGTMLGGTALTQGRLAVLRHRHPAEWRKLVDQFPHLENY
jgi:3'-phosphoadenosine 5'-phosphosulfate sulfotransferase (PAPS reductase)/FAD synthetase